LVAKASIDASIGMKAEVAMKDISIALLGTVFVIISLVSLISADRVPEASWMWGSAQEHISEIGLRYALQR
jgi:hypothetical protein